jgi:TolA-binding protein
MNNIVPTDEDCLSQDQLSRYIQEDCRLEEMRWIDRHLLNCPMCSDAVEGAMLSDMVDYQSVMSRLDDKIETRVNTNWATPIETPRLTVVPSKRFSIGQYGLKWAAAAGLTGVMAIGVWQYSTQNVLNSAPKMAAVKEAPMPEMAAAPAAPTVSEMPQLSVPTAVMPQPKSAAPSRSQKESSPAAPTPNVSASASPLSTTSLPGSPNPNSSVSTDNVQKEDIAAVSPNKNKDLSPIADNAMVKPTSDEIASEKSKEAMGTRTAKLESTQSSSKANLPPPASAEVADLDAQKGYDNNSNYGGAANQASLPAKKMKGRSSTTTLYDNAYNAYQQKSYTVAIAGFNQVLAQKPLDKNERYENTLWYLADSYLQTGDKATAKALLERIVAEKLQYQRKATLKLKEWD